MVAGHRVVQDQIRYMMVPRVVVQHLSCVAVQGLAEVCDLFALVVGLRFCMLLAQAVVPRRCLALASQARSMSRLCCSDRTVPE